MESFSPIIDLNTDTSTTSTTSDTNTKPTSPIKVSMQTPSPNAMATEESPMGSSPAASGNESSESSPSLSTILKNCSLSPAASALVEKFDSIDTSEAAKEIQREFRLMIQDEDNLNRAAEYLYDQLLDDIIMGIFLEVHQLYVTGNLDAIDGTPEEPQDPQASSSRINDKPDFDIFGNSTTKKAMECTCPNCDRPVAAGCFAKHLAKCMGTDRKSRSSKRLATKDGSAAVKAVSMIESDDDDDVESQWEVLLINRET